MKPRRHLLPDSAPSEYGVLPDAIAFQPPSRVRLGMDKLITREVIQDAVKEWRRKGKRIRKVKMQMEAPDMQIVGGRLKTFKASGFHEVETEEVKG